MIQEERQSFMNFLPESSILWFKDYQQSMDIIDKSFLKVEEQFQTIRKQCGNSSLITQPQQIFETQDSFVSSLDKFKKIEFGNNFV